MKWKDNARNDILILIKRLSDPNAKKLSTLLLDQTIDNIIENIIKEIMTRITLSNKK